MLFLHLHPNQRTSLTGNSYFLSWTLSLWMHCYFIDIYFLLFWYRNSKLTHILQSSLGEVYIYSWWFSWMERNLFNWCWILCVCIFSYLSFIWDWNAGGDCKTLMFVQISPSSADLGETICSLNFATRVRGIESGPARKQVDLTELFKYKQMVCWSITISFYAGHGTWFLASKILNFFEQAEKLKHDEKETKKLQDRLQSLQLRLAAREHMCRNLQEKVLYNFPLFDNGFIPINTVYMGDWNFP